MVIIVAMVVMVAVVIIVVMVIVVMAVLVNRVVIMVVRTGQAFTILAMLFMNILLLTRKARNGNCLRIHRVEKYNDAKNLPYWPVGARPYTCFVF